MANLGDISKINLPNGNVVNIKDATVRAQANWNTNNGVKNAATVNSASKTNSGYFFINNLGWVIKANEEYYIEFDFEKTAGDATVQLTNANGNVISTTYVACGSSSSGHAKRKIAPNVDAYGYNAYFNATGTITISNLMIYPAFITDDTFEPYALPNTKITPELIELVDSGAKNELNVTATSSGNFTVNSDKSITVNGSFSQAAEYTLASLTGTIKGVLSGCTNGSNSTYRMWIQYKINNGSVQRIDLLDGSVELDLSNVTWSAVQIRVESGQTLNNVKFYPMLCSKAAWDVSQKYVPYGMSNVELTVKAPVTKSKRHIPQSADYEIVSDLTISIPGGKKYLIHAMAMFSNVAPKGVIINKTNTIAANKNTVYAEITNDANDFGGLTTSAIMSNTGSTAFDVCIFAKFKSANVSGSDVIVTYQDIT